MKRMVWTLLSLVILLVPRSADAMNPRFTCTGYTVTYDDGTQRCTHHCTICRQYDANGEITYEGDPYCVDRGCIQVR